MNQFQCLLREYSMEQVEGWMRSGRVSTADYELYMYLWVNSAFHFGTHSPRYAPDCPPVEIEYRECDPAEFKFKE